MTQLEKKRQICVSQIIFLTPCAPNKNLSDPSSGVDASGVVALVRIVLGPSDLCWHPLIQRVALQQGLQAAAIR